jgi:hypothetical protein
MRQIVLKGEKGWVYELTSLIVEYDTFLEQVRAAATRHEHSIE